MMMIKQELIPIITSRGPSPLRSEHSSLPLNQGGLKFLTPDNRSGNLNWSKLLTSHVDDNDVIVTETKHYKIVHQIKKELQKLKICALTTEPDESQQYILSLVSENGASSCLAALLLK